MALGSGNAPRSRLRNKGWIVRDPFEPTRDPWTYQDYIRKSKGEFTVAKHGYAVSNCGWFSERSAVYLASGRPVMTQETGFSDWLATGAGLFSFRNLDEVMSGLEDINGRYEMRTDGLLPPRPGVDRVPAEGAAIGGRTGAHLFPPR